MHDVYSVKVKKTYFIRIEDSNATVPFSLFIYFFYKTTSIYTALFLLFCARLKQAFKIARLTYKIFFFFQNFYIKIYYLFQTKNQSTVIKQMLNKKVKLLKCLATVL